MFGTAPLPPQYNTIFVGKLDDATNVVLMRFPDSSIFRFGYFNFPSIAWLD